MDVDLIVIGGGLAGSEAAWQAAERGLRVALYEMRPVRMTPAHATASLAEIVCSNSLGSNAPGKAGGLLKSELRRLGSMVMACADETAVSAGDALAVDRERFSALVTERISSHPRITLVREEAVRVPDALAVIASGPLTSETLALDIGRLCGEVYLYFYDAMCPIVAADSIDLDVAWRGSRWGRDTNLVEGAESGDYINCPMSREEYEAFVKELANAETIALKSFEQEDPKFFEGCLPIEVMARRGGDTLAYGPMRPIGLRDPRTGKRPHAVAQLRKDNAAGDLYNVVGFQTNLTYGEQKRVLRMIPGLGHCEVMRYGQMHRNTFLNAPALLSPTMQLRTRETLFFAGQITGIEGYVGNIGSGLVAGVNAARLFAGLPALALPRETMMGALCHYVSDPRQGEFQPMKANFGILPPLVPEVRQKKERYGAYCIRAVEALEHVSGEWIGQRQLIA